VVTATGDYYDAFHALLAVEPELRVQIHPPAWSNTTIDGGVAEFAFATVVGRTDWILSTARY